MHFLADALTQLEASIHMQKYRNKGIKKPKNMEADVNRVLQIERSWSLPELVD